VELQAGQIRRVFIVEKLPIATDSGGEYRLS
jgi:hypothetical protein